MKIETASFWKGFASALALVAIVYVAIPATHDFTPRAHVFQMMSHVSSTKTTIEERAIKAKTLAGAGIGVEFPAWTNTAFELSFYRVTNDGVILIQGGRGHPLVVLLPALQDGKVSWTCVAGSWNAAPAVCR